MTFCIGTKDITTGEKIEYASVVARWFVHGKEYIDSCNGGWSGKCCLPTTWTYPCELTISVSGYRTFHDPEFDPPSGDWKTVWIDLEPVSMPSLEAVASANKTSGLVPLTVNFNGSASGGVLPYTYHWDFGDGNASSEQNPSHTYMATGTYTVTLTVIDYTLEASATDTISVTVTDTMEAGIPWWLIMFPLAYLAYKKLKK